MDDPPGITYSGGKGPRQSATETAPHKAVSASANITVEPGTLIGQTNVGIQFHPSSLSSGGHEQ